MRKNPSLLTGLLATALLLLAACSPKSKTVDYPLIGMASTEHLDIARVELTDSVTALHMDVYFSPNNWIRIASGSCLKADGQKYMLTGAEGITPDSLFWMPDSGKAHFTLYFEPIPTGTQTFDFTEGDFEGSYKLFDVDLTGREAFAKPKEVPDEAMSVALPDTMSGPVMESGQTTVRLHMLNYRPDCGIEKAALFVNTIFGTQDTYEATINTEIAQAEISFRQDGLVWAFVQTGHTFSGLAFLAPGESVDFYVDTHTGRYLFNKYTRQRPGDRATDRDASFRRMYATGTYAGLNNLLNVQASDASLHRFTMDMYTGTFADFHMTSAQYAAHVMDRYKALADSIAQSAASSLEKEYMTIRLRQEACQAMAKGNYLRRHNYMHLHNNWVSRTSRRTA